MVRLNKLTRILDKKDSSVCPHCEFVLPKKDAIISGWDSQSSLKHIHCPNCGKIITRTP